MSRLKLIPTHVPAQSLYQGGCTSPGACVPMTTSGSLLLLCCSSRRSPRTVPVLPTNRMQSFLLSPGHRARLSTYTEPSGAEGISKHKRCCFLKFCGHITEGYFPLHSILHSSCVQPCAVLPTPSSSHNSSPFLIQSNFCSPFVTSALCSPRDPRSRLSTPLYWLFQVFPQGVLLKAGFGNWLQGCL